MDGQIAIKKAVLHILDNNITVPVLSDMELEAEGEVCEFLEKHVAKIQEDNNLKNARFTGEENKVRFLCQCLESNTEDFLPITRDIAATLFDIMLKNVDIPPADLVCCLFNCNNRDFLGILKMNYRMGYTHYVQNDGESSANTLIKHKTLLPADGQKIDECILIDLKDCSIQLIEKEYEINGEKCCYLSRMFLKSDSDLSNNEKVKIINKAAQKLSKKYFDEDFEKTAQFKKAISESFEEKSAIEVDSLAREVFKNNIEVQNEYMEEVQKSGLTERTVEIPETLIAKKFQNHKIKTDTGIEINFPVDCYNDRDKIEFVNNPDGTISIIIKNVTRISNK